MAQDKTTGQAANDYGYRCARAVAKHLGAVVLGVDSNKIKLPNDELAVVKSAHHKTTQIGVSLTTLKEVKWIIAALEKKPTGITALDSTGTEHELYKMSLRWYKQRMKDSKSNSQSAEEIKMVDTAIVKKQAKPFDSLPAGWDARGRG